MRTIADRVRPAEAGTAPALSPEAIHVKLIESVAERIPNRFDLEGGRQLTRLAQRLSP